MLTKLFTCALFVAATSSLSLEQEHSLTATQTMTFAQTNAVSEAEAEKLSDIKTYLTKNDRFQEWSETNKALNEFSWLLNGGNLSMSGNDGPSILNDLSFPNETISRILSTALESDKLYGGISKNAFLGSAFPIPIVDPS